MKLEICFMTANKSSHIGILFLVLVFAAVMFGFFFYLKKGIGGNIGDPVLRPKAQFHDNIRLKTLIGGVTLDTEVAKSDAKRNVGLSGRSGLSGSQGMLFVFNGYGKYAIWNKDMLFPIDVLWIKDEKIVDIYENMAATSADSKNIIVAPKQDANFVLEVNAGFVKEHGIKVSDKIVFSSK